MKRPARVPCEPCLDLGMLERGVVVDYGFDQFAGWHCALDIVDEADELLVPMLLHAATDHRTVEYPITEPSSTLSAANNVVVPWR